MRLQRSHSEARTRRGMILLIVLVMLTMFAIAGLTFVLYAESAAESARINRSSETFSATSLPDMDPNTSFSLFMGQLVYGVADPAAAPGGDPNSGNSALRGHSLAETMYGSFDAQGGAPMDVPYSGTGRLNEGSLYAGIPNSSTMVNYTYFANTDPGTLRDPARLSVRTGSGQPRGQYTGGLNVPYTYPDLNSMFLATIRASDGTVLQASYHRDNTGSGGFGTLAPNNPNWTTGSAGKYLTLRPRPADMGPGFPPPTSNAGIPGSVIPAADVKNLTGMPGGNDSIWIDINAPVLTTASGLRYKMLVAPLILDLDNRINLNVVGNILGRDAAGNIIHSSNQGWGPWEINMSKVLNAAAGPKEWQNIFLGNPVNGAIGRYGPDGLPSTVFPLSGPIPHVYAQGDLNSTQDPAPNVPTGPYVLPGAGYFPTFPAGYSNGSGETTNGGTSIHPMFYNVFNASGDDRLFPLSAHASLLWAGTSASPTSDLVRLCGQPGPPLGPLPKQFTFNSVNDAAGTIRRINQTTLLSMDLDRSGAAPYIFPNASDTPYGISYNLATSAYSYGAPAANPLVASFPPLASRGGATPANSEFDPNTWQSVLARTLPRIDLDRQLAVYPASGVQPPDRQQFAMEIYNRLLAVTGMTGSYKSLGSMPPPSAPQYNSLRWLAQLSANIVDYIDTDDVMTAFQWAQGAQLQGTDTGYVFGTELPKLVVNEVYLEYDNDQGDPGMIVNPNPPPPMIPAAKRLYHMNVWAELLNPLPTTPETGTNPPNNANLVDVNGNPIYQLVITSPNQSLRNPDNLAGDPDGAANHTMAPYAVQGPTGSYTPTGSYNSAAPGGQVLAVVNTWGTVQNVTPVGTNTSTPPGPPAAPGTSSPGFLIIGPPNPPTIMGQPGGTQTQLNPSITANNMAYTVPNADASADAPVPPTVLLQRLANPNQPWNAVTNPYITVDYVDMNAVGAATAKTVVNDARQYKSTGLNPAWAVNQDPNKRFSFGRKQAYAGNANQWQQQQAPAMPALTANQPTTTFFSVNTPATPAAPADWLVHLDRPLISPIELLHVSGFKPQELTQQFIDGAGNKFGQMAPWTDQNGSSRLYRLLEFVKTKNPTPGIVNGGRVPGKININTLDGSINPNTGLPGSIEVFRAMCDAQQGNSFYNSGMGTTDDYVDKVFKNLMAGRTPAGSPSAADNPLWGMAPGDATGGDAMSTGARGFSQTLTGAMATAVAAAGPPPGGTHPYQQAELLNKIYNNVTTRSNCFAVWLTVGFFPVTNDTVQPNQLGPEINLAQGKNIRHHMFAIVDRTQVQTWKTGALQTNVAIAAGNGVSIGVPTSVNDSRTGVTWQIQDGTTPAASPLAGSTLVYDPGAGNEETVVVQPGFVANFTQNHIKGANVISRGHPGPWNLPGNLKYDATQDTSVVPYFKLID